MNIERFKILVEAYGALPAHWPEAERKAAMAFVEASPEARRLLEEAAALDRLLDAADTAPASRALEERILATFPGRAPSWRRSFVLAAFPARWLPGAALACSLLLGLLVGAVLPSAAGIGEGVQADPALIALAGDESDFWSDLGDGS